MSGTASTHCDLYVNSIPTGSPYVSDTVTVSDCTLTVGDTFDNDFSGWRIGDDGVRWLSTDTITLGGTVELEDRMHVFEVIAVNRRTLDVISSRKVAAINSNHALIKLSSMFNGSSFREDEIDDWHIEVRKLFSFEPIESDK